MSETALELKSSQQWWDEVKVSEEKTVEWLKNQYHGEALASERIRQFILPHFEGNHKTMVEKIANDEDTHAQWVGELLSKRGVTPEILQKEERYWREVMTEEFSQDAQYASAVAAHAEEMRLERISVIMNDADSPEDIKNVFTQIYKDELFHAKAFKTIAGDDYYDKASENHAKGIEKLGLII